MSFTRDGNTDDILFYVYIYDGTNLKVGGWAYDHDNAKFQCYDSTLTLADALTSAQLSNGAWTWHTAKFVIDTSADTYRHLLVDKRSVDLSSWSLYSTASATLPKMELYIIHKTDIASNPVIYIDNVIVTENEP
jgi:hypothetical protein